MREDLELNNKFSLSLVLCVDLLALCDDLEGWNGGGEGA